VADVLDVDELLLDGGTSVRTHRRRKLDHRLALEVLQPQAHGDALPQAARDRARLSPQLPVIDVAVDLDGPAGVTRLHGGLIAQEKRARRRARPFRVRYRTDQAPGVLTPSESACSRLS